jgi:hypothetical protein
MLRPSWAGRIVWWSLAFLSDRCLAIILYNLQTLTTLDGRSKTRILICQFVLFMSQIVSFANEFSPDMELRALPCIDTGCFQARSGHEEGASRLNPPALTPFGNKHSSTTFDLVPTWRIGIPQCEEMRWYPAWVVSCSKNENAFCSWPERNFHTILRWAGWKEACAEYRTKHCRARL